MGQGSTLRVQPRSTTTGIGSHQLVYSGLLEWLSRKGIGGIAGGWNRVRQYRLKEEIAAKCTLSVPFQSKTRRSRVAISDLNSCR